MYFNRSTIIDDVIGELYKSQEDSDACTGLLEPESPADEGKGEIAQCIGPKGIHYDDGKEMYVAAVQKCPVFSVVPQYIACGVSFRTVARLAKIACDELTTAMLYDVSEDFVRKSVRLGLCASLEKLAVLLCDKKCRAFSLVFDGVNRSRNILSRMPHPSLCQGEYCDLSCARRAY